jgi:hypothetical protein
MSYSFDLVRVLFTWPIAVNVMVLSRVNIMQSFVCLTEANLQNIQ